MTRCVQRAALPLLLGIALVSGAAAETHVAAVTSNSIPRPSKQARKLPIDIIASKGDYKGDSGVFEDVVITQGETRVQADRARATGLDDIDNSHWTFEGNVRVNGEQHGSLKADTAIVEYRNHDISKVTVTGNPAEFEQKRADTDQVARGHAHQIVYDLGDGTVRLLNDAWVWDGQHTLSAPELVYNIREQHVQATAEPGTGSQVHLHIDPNAPQDSNPKP